MANSAVLLLPAPTLTAIGAVSNGRLTGTIALTLPVPQLTASGEPGGNTAALTLPVPSLSARGNTANVGTVSLTLPTPQLAAAGTATNVGTIALTLPVPQLRASSPNVIALALPTPQISASGQTGVVGSIALGLPTPELVAAGKIPFTGQLVATLPVPQLVISGTVGNVGALSNTLRGIALAAQGATGTVGRIALVLPVQGTLENDWQGGLSASGGPVGTGTVTLVLPMLVLQATGETSAVTPGAPDGDVLPALVVHTETGALSTYLNYPFNSMAAFNGVYLGASAEGLFVLTGDTDNGVAIAAAARVGITDFGTSFMKRIDRCYIGYTTDGNMTLNVWTDDRHGWRSYNISMYGKDGVHGNHTRIGKGIAARYWQFELANQNGAWFELNALELKPTHLRRRIGGGDA